MTLEQKPKKRGSQDFWRAARFLYPYRKHVAISVVSAMIAGTIMTSGIATMMPIVKVLVGKESLQEWAAKLPAAWYSQAINSVIAQLPTNRVQLVALFFAGIAVLATIGNVIRYIYEYLSDRCAIYAVNDVRRALYDHALHLPLSYYGNQGTSEITSRLAQDCQALQEGFKILLGQTLLEMIRAVLAFAAAILLDWRLTIFIVLFAPLSMTVIRKIGKRMRRASRAALQNSAAMLGQVEASLNGIRVVKAATAERFERRRYSGIMDFLRREQLKLAHYDALSTPALETLGLLLVGAVLIFATYLMFGDSVTNKLTETRFIAIMVAFVQIGESLRRVSKVNTVVQRSNAAAARVFEVIDVPVERPRLASARRAGISDAQHLINLPPLEREVRFESIAFTYPGAKQPALSDVELAVPKGRSVAIVGRNGSGKTTLMALLPRFFDPDRGRVTIDGIDIRNVTLRSLRRQIAVVTQDSVIFPGTVAENIAYGLPRATRAQIEDAARRAFAHDFIMEKPQGYDAPLEGLGGQLSGGQKQRINIARAILRSAPILILDEATSQVDAESEHLIQQAIEKLMHERTTFVIAHRFSTILSADWIVVMERGQIDSQGTHAELLRTSETYRQLYERQLGRDGFAA